MLLLISADLFWCKYLTVCLKLVCAVTFIINASRGTERYRGTWWCSGALVLNKITETGCWGSCSGLLLECLGHWDCASWVTLYRAPDAQELPPRCEEGLWPMLWWWALKDVLLASAQGGCSRCLGLVAWHLSYQGGYMERALAKADKAPPAALALGNGLAALCSHVLPSVCVVVFLTCCLQTLWVFCPCGKSLPFCGEPR